MKPDFSVAGDQAPVSLNTCSAGFLYIVVTLPISLTFLLLVKIEQEACQKSHQSQWTFKNKWVVQRR